MIIDLPDREATVNLGEKLKKTCRKEEIVNTVPPAD